MMQFTNLIDARAVTGRQFENTPTMHDSSPMREPGAPVSSLLRQRLSSALRAAAAVIEPRAPEPAPEPCV